jgi:hypothetical protein
VLVEVVKGVDLECGTGMLLMDVCLIAEAEFLFFCFVLLKSFFFSYRAMRALCHSCLIDLALLALRK